MNCKFKPGTYWRTRDGRKAYIQAVLLPSPDGRHASLPVRGCLYTGEWSFGACWTLNGHHRFDGTVDDFDLVAPCAEDYAVINGQKYKLVKD